MTDVRVGGRWVLATRHRFDGPAVLVGVGAAFGLVAQLTLLLDDPLGQGAAFFPAAGVSLSALLMLHDTRWGWALAGVGIAEFVGDLAHGFGVVPCLWWALANVLEPLLGAALVRATTRGPRLLVPARNVLCFLAAAALVAPAVAAALGALGTTMQAGYDYSTVWVKWFVGDALGVLVVAPAILSLREAPSPRGILERACFVVCLAVLTVVMFKPWRQQLDISASYLVMPILMWAAFRHGLRWTAWSVAVLTQAINAAAGRGHGPFATLAGTDEPSLSLTSLQVYLAAAAATALIVAALVQDLVHRREIEVALERAAYIDALTGLPNRAFLERRLGADDSACPAAVLMCDVDNFKAVNDSAGHHAGDELLVEIAKRMRADLPPDALLARMGGDEFVVLLPDDAARPAEVIAREIIASVGAPLRLGTASATVVTPSMSIGFTTLGCDTPAHRALRDADAAMYEAKARGRGQVQRFDQRLQTRAIDRSWLEADIAAAIDEAQIFCVYQAEFDVRTGRPICMEALARWAHPTRGIVMPDSFIPVVESTGFASSLFDLVFERALDAWSLWSRLVPDVPDIAVNLSARLLADPTLPSRIVDQLAARGVPASALWLEVTESGFADTGALQTVAELHELGISLAIDDFGTGWSSMSRLAELPWDALKIDRSFVGRLGPGRAATTVLDAMIGLAHSMNLRAIAEGVETLDQLEYLRHADCDSVQGYLFGEPGDAVDVVDLLSSASSGT